MFDQPFEQRMSTWREFRASLEESEDPLREVIRFYNKAPISSSHLSPWDRESWPDPWNLLLTNQYCEFSTVLGMCYSLQLTDRFKDSRFEIHIITDNCLSYRYLLIVDDSVIGFDDRKIVSKDSLPKDLEPQRSYTMPALH